MIYKNISNMRIAHLRANYEDPNHFSRINKIKVQNLAYLADFLVEVVKRLSNVKSTKTGVDYSYYGFFRKKDKEEKVVTKAKERESLTDELRFLFGSPSENFLLSSESLPVSIEQEIQKAYKTNLVRNIPAYNVSIFKDAVLFFIRLFPQHIDIFRNLKLSVKIIDSPYVSFGATLRGNTLYIQRGCIEKEIGRKVTLDELYKVFNYEPDTDPNLIKVIQKIIVHEFGAALFKLSHPVNEELEELFLGRKLKLSYRAQREIEHIREVKDLSKVKRTDWAFWGFNLNTLILIAIFGVPLYISKSIFSKIYKNKKNLKIAGTILSIITTFGTGALLEYSKPGILKELTEAFTQGPFDSTAIYGIPLALSIIWGGIILLNIISGFLGIFLGKIIFYIFKLIFCKKSSQSEKLPRLPFWKTMREIVPARSKWIRDFYYTYYGDLDEETLTGLAILGWGIGAVLLYCAYHYHWGGLGTDSVSKILKWIVWIAGIGLAPLLAIVFPYIIGKGIDLFRTIWRLFKYPFDYYQIERINEKSSEEISDKQFKKAARIYARMSEDYLTNIFQAWIDVSQEEKIGRLFKLGKWDSDKIKNYVEIGEYKLIKQQAAAKFATTIQEQKALFDTIDRKKERLIRKGFSNGMRLIINILPSLIEHSKNRTEFFYWLNLIIELPDNIWRKGTKAVLSVFVDLREFENVRKEILRKFTTTYQEQVQINRAIDKLKAKLDREGFNSADLLKRILPEVSRVSRNLKRFLILIQILTNFDRNWWSSKNNITVFLDILSYESAKETVADKLIKEEERKRFLEKIDSYRLKLEKKKLNGVKLLKEIIVEIANNTTTTSEFFSWLDKIFKLEESEWRAGAEKILAGFYELKSYRDLRINLSEKFTRTKKEKTRLDKLWNNLEVNINWTKVNSVSLLKQAIDRIGNFAKDSKEFIYWIGTLSEIRREIMEEILTKIDLILDFYKKEREGRDWDNFPRVLNRYYSKYRQPLAIFKETLNILTNASLEISERIKNIREEIITQKFTQLGVPLNLINLQDVVSIEELISLQGEDKIKKLIRFENISSILSKMGKEGMYSYFEEAKPAYYQEFLEETQGLKAGFNKPEEKIRVVYEDVEKDVTEVMPIYFPLDSLRKIVMKLKQNQKALYNHLYKISKKARRIKEGEELEEAISQDKVLPISKMLLKKIRDWRQTKIKDRVSISISDEEETEYLETLTEILSAENTKTLRDKLYEEGNKLSHLERLKLLSRYWKIILGFIEANRNLYLDRPFKNLSKRINEKIDYLNYKLHKGGKGILQFYLSGGALADFFRGDVSCDCSSFRSILEDSTYTKFREAAISSVVDPAFFLYKIIEDEKWIGNVYSLVCKTEDGKFALFIDWFKINTNHNLSHANTVIKEKITQEFIRQFKIYLASLGFDYLIIARDTGGFLDNGVKKLGNSEELRLKKIGGVGYLQEFSLNQEFVQNFAHQIGSGFHTVQGYKIRLDKKLKKDFMIEEIRKLKGLMSSLEDRKRVVLTTKAHREKHLNELFVFLEEVRKHGIEEPEIVKKTEKIIDIKRHEIKDIELEVLEIENQIAFNKKQLNLLEEELAKSSSSIFKWGFVATLTILLTQFACIFTSQPNNFTFILIESLLLMVLISLIYLLLKSIIKDSYKKEDFWFRYKHSVDIVKPIQTEHQIPKHIIVLLEKVLERIPESLTCKLAKPVKIHVPLSGAIRAEQALQAIQLLFVTLLKYGSIFAFFEKQKFYLDFKLQAEQLGLREDFDRSFTSYTFLIKKEEIIKERKELFEIETNKFLQKIDEGVEIILTKYKKGELIKKIKEKRKELKSILYKFFFEQYLEEYFILLKTLGYMEFKDELSKIKDLIKAKRYSQIYSIIHQFFTVKLDQEIIEKERNLEIKKALRNISNKHRYEMESLLNNLIIFEQEKKRLMHETCDIKFELILSNRTFEDILRGEISNDCTALTGAAFYNTIPQFLFDPGFLCFKLLKEGEWVGNVYALVAKMENKPVLIIDAIQLPPISGRWPIAVEKIAEKAIEGIITYADNTGFAEVVMSSFISNFINLREYFGKKYKLERRYIEKLGGFKHLKALKLWDDKVERNEYIETLNPVWNYGLKVNPNIAKQVIFIRPVWKRRIITQEGKASSSLKGEIELWIPQEYISKLISEIPLHQRIKIEKRFLALLSQISIQSVNVWQQTYDELLEKGVIKPWCLPLPVSAEQIRHLGVRSQVIKILQEILMWMDNADSYVIEDLMQAIKNARDEITKDIFEKLDTISDQELESFLTIKYFQRLSQEIAYNIYRFFGNMHQAIRMASEYENLSIDEETKRRFPRLPQYLVWLLTQNPQLQNDREIRDYLNLIYQRMNKLPKFVREISQHSIRMFVESLRQNPKLALRILEYFLRDIPEGRKLIIKIKERYRRGNKTEGDLRKKDEMICLEKRRELMEESCDEIRQELFKIEEELNRLEDIIIQNENKLKELRSLREDALCKGCLYPVEAILDPSIKKYEQKLKRLYEEREKLIKTKLKYEEEDRRRQVKVSSDTGSSSLRWNRILTKDIQNSIETPINLFNSVFLKDSVQTGRAILESLIARAPPVNSKESQIFQALINDVILHETFHLKGLNEE
ncbi:MAG: MFS transporter, partial [Candidatus Omnitrophica bacterium]|nr:MFS transporter [Candidatus Omnitrophota bacterium]